jgi:hypothetical protein
VYVDTSRASFDPAKHYSAVLLQQGRVILDSDVGEQNAILAHYLRTAIGDIIGLAACPAAAPGFGITMTTTQKQPDLGVSAGRIYVRGILAETGPDGSTYLTQPDGCIDPDLDGLPAEGGYLVYLRVWERSVTAIQDPGIREVALGIHGPDTTARAKVVWQIAIYPAAGDASAQDTEKAWQAWYQGLYQPAGTMRAQAKQPHDAELDICSVAPQAQYRGRENQHYRVEILVSGQAVQQSQQVSTRPGRGKGNQPSVVAQYVFSRENGSVDFAVKTLAGAEVTLTSLGRDLPSSLEIGDYVEIADDASASRVADEVPTGPARSLFQVTAIDALNCVVTLDRNPSGDIGTTGSNPALHPLLRRWDGAGAADVTEGTWLDLEDGVQVLFPGSGNAKQPARYRTGDYWLIPARTALGDVVWPKDDSGPQALPPAGISYYYAPLAFVPADRAVAIVDLRQTFSPIAV